MVLYSSRYARVVELADSLDSGSSVHYARAGSSPASRTKIKDIQMDVLYFMLRRLYGTFGIETFRVAKPSLRCRPLVDY